MIQGPLNAETAEYHRNVQNDYSTETVRAIVKAGNAAVHTSGGMGDALFQFQEHEFRPVQPQFDYIQENQHWIPQLADEMLETMRVGVTASYTRPPTSNSQTKGVPVQRRSHNRNNSKVAA